MYNSKLWQTSGHWDLYADNMFRFEVEKEKFGLKPMNCPGHCLIFDHGIRYSILYSGDLNTVGAGIPNTFRNHIVGVCSVLQWCSVFQWLTKWPPFVQNHFLEHDLTRLNGLTILSLPGLHILRKIEIKLDPSIILSKKEKRSNKKALYFLESNAKKKKIS